MDEKSGASRCSSTSLTEIARGRGTRGLDVGPRCMDKETTGAEECPSEVRVFMRMTRWGLGVEDFPALVSPSYVRALSSTSGARQ